LSRLDKGTFDTDDWFSLNVDELPELKAGDPVFVIAYSETLFDGTFCEWLMADRPPQGETKVAQMKFPDIAWKKTWPPECLVRRRTVDEKTISPKAPERNTRSRDANRRGP
jgi:hypothetical protein